MLRPGVASCMFVFLVDLYCTKEFRDFPFWTKVSGETVAQRPAFRRSTFTGAPCSFFVHCLFFVAVERCFLWQVQDFGHFFTCATGAAFSARCSNIGRRGSKWEAVSKRSVWWTWTTFDRLESLVLWNGRRYWFGACSWSCATGTLLRTLRFIICGKRSTSETSTKNRGWSLAKPRFSFSMFILRGARCIWWKWNMCCTSSLQRSCPGTSCREPAQGPRDCLVQRSREEVFHGDFAQRSCIKMSCSILPRDLFQRSCTATLQRDLLQRSCQEVSYRDLAARSSSETM